MALGRLGLRSCLWHRSVSDPHDPDASHSFQRKKSVRKHRKRMRLGGATPQAAGKPRASGRSASHFRPRCRGAGPHAAATCGARLPLPAACGEGGRAGPRPDDDRRSFAVPSALCTRPASRLPPRISFFTHSFPRPSECLRVPFLFAGSGALEKEDKKGSECELKMEEAAQAPDWDSDETVIDGSVTESDLEEEELPWRR